MKSRHCNIYKYSILCYENTRKRYSINFENTHQVKCFMYRKKNCMFLDIYYYYNSSSISQRVIVILIKENTHFLCWTVDTALGGRLDSNLIICAHALQQYKVYVWGAKSFKDIHPFLPPLLSSSFFTSLSLSPLFLPPVLIVLTCYPTLRHAADVPAVGIESSGHVTWATAAAYKWGADGREGLTLHQEETPPSLHSNPPTFLLPLPPHHSGRTERMGGL